MRVSRYAKAIVAALAAGAASLSTAMGDGIVTSGEGVTAVVAVIAAYGVTYKVPNREPKDPS